MQNHGRIAVEAGGDQLVEALHRSKVWTARLLILGFVLVAVWCVWALPPLFSPVHTFCGEYYGPCVNPSFGQFLEIEGLGVIGILGPAVVLLFFGSLRRAMLGEGGKCA